VFGFFSCCKTDKKLSLSSSGFSHSIFFGLDTDYINKHRGVQLANAPFTFPLCPHQHNQQFTFLKLDDTPPQFLVLLWRLGRFTLGFLLFPPTFMYAGCHWPRPSLTIPLRWTHFRTKSPPVWKYFSRFAPLTLAQSTTVYFFFYLRPIVLGFLTCRWQYSLIQSPYLGPSPSPQVSCPSISVFRNYNFGTGSEESLPTSHTGVSPPVLVELGAFPPDL